MSKTLAKLCNYISSYSEAHPNCSKEQIQKATAQEFSLEKKSVYSCAEFALYFASVQGTTFANTVRSLSTLRKYDHIPFIVCVVRPNRVELMLANSTFSNGTLAMTAWGSAIKRPPACAAGRSVPIAIQRKSMTV